MSDKKISQLIDATTPLAGTEVLPIVQSSTTKKTMVATLLGYANPSDNAIVRYDGTGGAVQNSTCFIDDSGNLGVGTNSAAQRLDVSSTPTSDTDLKYNVVVRSADAYSTTPQAGIAFATYFNSTQNLPLCGIYGGKENALEGNFSSKISFATRTNGGNIIEQMRLNSTGNLTVPAIYTNTTASVAYVAVDSNGLLQRGGVSALRYKQDVRDLEHIDVNLFRPVRYKSKCENDDQALDHFGIIADEVDAAGIKELVTYGENGEVEGFQYERLTVVLLKEIQNLKSRIEQIEKQ